MSRKSDISDFGNDLNQREIERRNWLRNRGTNASRRLARLVAESDDNRSDPFAYGRALLHATSGLLTADDLKCNMDGVPHGGKHKRRLVES